MRKLMAWGLASLALAAPGVNPALAQSSSQTQLSLYSSQGQPSAQVWDSDVGEGFCRGAQSLTLTVGASAGVAMLGGTQHHDLALAGVTYGRVFGPVLAPNHWYRGNLEGRIELFGGAQFSPSEQWIAGLTPHLRYDFATGTPWVPFIDAGAGVTGTGIGRPDLSGTFEFNLQGCVGTYYFFRNNLAVDIDARLLHLSCARISTPNLGLNTILGTIGVSWFF